MKKIILLLVVLGFTINTQAQIFNKERVMNDENVDKARLSWGYYLGFNTYDFKIRYNNSSNIAVENSVGFNVGLIGNVRINDYFDIRFEPGVVFPSRNLRYQDLPDKNFRELKSTYVHLPLLLKISTKRLNNFKPFIVGGIATSINLGSNQKNPDDNSSGQFRMKTSTNYYEVGFGVDLYLPYFKFSPSIRGVFATTDELVPDNDPNSVYTAQIDRLETRGVFVNFTFQ